MSFRSVHSSSLWMLLTAQNMAQLFTIHPSYHGTEELLQLTGNFLHVVHQNYVYVLVGCLARPITHVIADTFLLTCNCSEASSVKQLSIWVMNCSSYLRFSTISTASAAVILGRSVM